MIEKIINLLQIVVDVVLLESPRVFTSKDSNKVEQCQRPLSENRCMFKAIEGLSKNPNDKFAKLKEKLANYPCGRTGIVERKVIRNLKCFQLILN